MALTNKVTCAMPHFLKAILDLGLIDKTDYFERMKQIHQTRQNGPLKGTLKGQTQADIERMNSSPEKKRKQ